MKVKLFLLTLVMVIMSSNITVLCQSYSMLIDEQYDNYATNSVPEKGTLTSPLTIALVEENLGGKCLSMSGNDGKIGIEYKFSASQKVQWIDTQIMPIDSAWYISIKDSMNTVVDIVKMDNGELTIYGGSKSQYNKNEFQNIVIRYNAETNRVRVYNGQVEIADDVVISRFGTLATVSISTICESQSQIKIDDLKVYENFYKIQKDSFMRSEYNKATIKDPAPVKKIVEEEKDYFNFTFEKDVIGNAPSNVIVFNNGGKVLVVDEKSREGKELVIKRTGSTNPYVDFTFDSSATTEKSSLVIETDMLAVQGTSRVQLFTLRDQYTQWLPTMFLQPNGVITLTNGQVIASNITGKWTHITVAFNFIKKNFSIYINGEEKVSNVAFSNGAFGRYVQIVRFMFDQYSTGKEQLVFDNVVSYTGTKIREKKIEKEQVTGAVTNENPNLDSVMDAENLFTSFKDVRESLSGTVAFVTGSKGMYANGKRTKMDATAFVKNNRTMVPLKYLGEGFGMNVSWDDANKVAKIGEKIEIKENSNILKVDGKDIEMDVSSFVKDGRMYLPVRFVAEKGLGKKVYTDNLGNVIISDKEKTFDYRNEFDFLKRVSFYIATDMPTPNQIIADFKKANPDNVHPRLFAKQKDFELIKKRYQANEEFTVKGIKKMLVDADAILKKPMPKYTLIANGVLERTVTMDTFLTLYIAYTITEDEKYLEHAAKLADALASFQDFHEYIGLDFAEFTAYAAIAYDLFYNLFDKDLIEKLKDSIMNKGLKFGMMLYEKQGFSTQNDFSRWNTNWNLVCNGALAVGAVALLGEETEFSAKFLQYALISLQYAAVDYAPDGAWKEGPSYWNYGTSWLTNLMASLKMATDEHYGIMDIPGIKQACFAQIYVAGEKGLFALQDGSTGAIPNHPVFLWFAKQLMNSDLVSLRMSLMERFKIEPTVWDVIWYDNNLISKDVNLQLDKVLGFCEIASMRSGFNSGETFLAFAAGDNSVTHGNLHMGTFTFEMIGERWAEEMGGDSYSLPGYFARDVRYDYYVAATEGQNCYVINPAEFGHGNQEFKASSKAELIESKPRGAIAKADLITAYNKSATSAIRGYMLADNRDVITIQDEILLSGESELYWFMHTLANIEIASDGKNVILSKNGKKIKMIVESNENNFEIVSMPAKPLPSSPQLPGQLSNPATKNKVAIHFPKTKGKLTIKTSFMPLDKESSYSGIIPIKDWTIPDGEQIKVSANNIYVNNQSLKGFSKSQYFYKHIVGYGEIPMITADADTKVTVTQATITNNTATVIVENTEQPKSPAIYKIDFVNETKIGTPSGNEIPIKTSTASSEPQPQNPIKDAIDGDLNTRWSADKEQWYLVDLGEVKEIINLAFYFMNTDGRKAIFDILVSEDGVNYTKVFSGQSSGDKEEWDLLTLSGIKARYIKYDAHGNNKHGWNSIYEFKVYGK